MRLQGPLHLLRVTRLCINSDLVSISNAIIARPSLFASFCGFLRSPCAIHHLAPKLALAGTPTVGANDAELPKHELRAGDFATKSCCASTRARCVLTNS